MKKLIAVMVAALGVSAMAYDDYFYWMVGNDTGDYSWVWTGARISGDNGDTYLALVDSWFNDIGDVASKADAQVGVFSGYTIGSTYLVELLWGDTAVARATVADNSIVDDNRTSDFTMERSKPFLVGGFKATGVVPEPTSGLLSLFGLALLAIRRKKVA